MGRGVTFFRERMEFLSWRGVLIDLPRVAHNMPADRQT